MKHTPGPWKADQADEFGDHNITPANEIAAVAAVVSNLRLPEEVRSNAALIAAAPDMLAALKAINRRINELAQDARKPHVRDIQDFQRWSAAAIAKTEA